jgi:hypothetical protein
MGCDIHLLVEKEVDSKWSVEEGFVADFYDKDDNYFSRSEFLSTERPVQKRNYPLFSVLAGVRSDDEVTPISEPRGFPSDISEFARGFYCSWDLDLHTRSYVYLNEVLAYLETFNETYSRKVKLTQDKYKEYIKTGKVDNTYSPLTYNQKLVPVTDEDMRKIIQGKIKAEAFTTPYVEKVIDVPVISYLDDFINKTIPQLKERSSREDYSDIRLVFGFDN